MEYREGTFTSLQQTYAYCTISVHMLNNTLTTTKLRANIYEVFDEIIKTGVPKRVKKDGNILTIQITERSKKINKMDKLSNLKPYDIVNDIALDTTKIWDEDAWKNQWDELLDN